MSAQRFETRVLERLGEDVCLRFEGRSWTGWELREDVEQLSSELGPLYGARVGVALAHQPRLVAAVLAILKSGGVCVPINPSTPEKRLEQLLSKVEASKLLHQGGLRELGPPPTPQTETTGQGPDEPAFIFFTSGSSGEPKGVLQSHRQVGEGQLGPLHHLGLGPQDRLLMRAPISTSGLACEIAWPLSTGGRLVLAPEQTKNDPLELLRLVLRESVTVLLVTPSLLSLLVEEEEFSRCTSLRYLITAGESLSPDLLEKVESRLPGRLGMIYGTTEAPSTSLRLPGTEGDCHNVGRVVATKEVKIVEGEVYVSGGIAECYWQEPILTSERFVRLLDSDKIWYRTGDLGTLTQDGCLLIQGRADRQLKIRGFRVEPEEVESALRTHPLVKQAAVDSVDGNLVAWVVLEEPLASPALQAHCRQHLSAEMLPQSIQIVDSFPLNAGGKLDRKALPRPEASGAPPETDTDTETILSFIQQSLANRNIEADDDFFERGGHSLAGVKLLLKIEQHFGRRLPSSVLQGRVSAHSLSGALNNIERAPSLVQLQGRGQGVPLVCHPGLSGESIEFRKFATHLRDKRPVLAFQAHGTDGSERGDKLTLSEAVSEYLPLLPKGPLHLLGFSAGACYVFELALQCQAQGLEVAWLGIVDAPAPDHDQQNFFLSFQRKNFLWFLRDLAPRIRTFEYRRLLGLAKTPQKKRRTRARRAMPSIRKRVADYKPRGKFDGTIHLLRASVQTFLSAHTKTMGWENHCQKVQVVRYDGHHHTLAQEPERIIQALGW